MALTEAETDSSELPLQHTSPSGQSVPHLKRAFTHIPDDASVSAHYSYVPHLSHREEIYMCPNPFSSHVYGTSRLSGQRLPEADGVEYVIVPTNLDPEPRRSSTRSARTSTWCTRTATSPW